MEKSNMEKSNIEEQMEYDENFDESFIIDENTYNDIINNSINICKKKDENICYYCKKEIINFFANNCNREMIMGSITPRHVRFFSSNQLGLFWFEDALTQ